MFASAAGDSKARRTGMRRQFAPFNFDWVFLVDLAQPALIRSHIARTVRRARLGAVYDHDSLAGYATREAEDGCARERSGLTPGIFFDVVNLNIVDWTFFRSSADQVDEAVMRYSHGRAVHGDGNVLAAMPVAFFDVNIHIGNCDFIALGIQHIPAHKNNLVLSSSRRCTQAAANSWHGAAQMPLGAGECHHVDLIGDVVPCFPGANSHYGKKFEPVFEAGDRVA